MGQRDHVDRATRAFVGLGANLGEREKTIRRALERLGDASGVAVVAVSALRETEPWGPVAQPQYLNGVAELATTLEPETLLSLLLEVERSLGRTREGERWGPRMIDLDLLLYGDAELDVPGLTLPHPRLHERRFVLGPLAELAPEAIVPGLGPVAALLESSNRKGGDTLPP
ncbi:MAG: 2-amino-4-hydroxy-6-hydroxymethyldihydropteridine diphosphokinase [Actinobacteria bacterium]|nr:2-amino-4-hydroxy-6-hydroxymethyldihydropteridine diphosphokinase [Actinomycetota bacterium]